MSVKGQPPQQPQLVLTMSGGSGSSNSQAPPSHINSQERDKDKDNRDRYMAAYNLAAFDQRERNARSGQPTSSSTGAPPPPSSNPYTALPRADLSFSVQGYQTAPSPSSNNQMQQQQQHHHQQQQQQQPPPRKSENAHHLSAAAAAADYSKASGVIVGPGERIDSRSDSRDPGSRSSSFEVQRAADLRDRTLERPTLSYKPYETTPRLGSNNNNGSSGSSSANIRSSRSPHPQMTPPTSAASSYPIHYAGSSQHSYSPNPAPSSSSRSGPSSVPQNSYMPPPSVSPSRSPAAVAHVPPYPAMRYSPAPQTAPAPCTSPQSSNQKKTSPSPLQQQQNMAGASATLYGRPLTGVVGPAGISSGTPVCRSDNTQTLPLSLITPSKANQISESAPPPAHTARSADRDRELRERELRDRERDVRLYPHVAYPPMPPHHQLQPPPQLTGSGGSSNRVPGAPLIPQQQPLDLGTYREDSPIPLITPARLSTASGETQVKKSRLDPPPQQQPPPPPPQIPMPPYPSLAPVGFPGAPLMSVAALIDAGYTTSGTAQVKPPTNPAFALGLTRHPSDTPPLLVSSVPVVPSADRPAETSTTRPVVIKSEPGIDVVVPPPPPTVVEPERATVVSRSSPPVVPAVVVKQEDVKVKQEPTVTASWSNPSTNTPATTTTTAASSVPPNPPASSNSSAKPVHKLKTAWLQRHTGSSLFNLNQ